MPRIYTHKPVIKCSVEGCDDWEYARGWCSKHWQRMRMYGRLYLITQEKGTARTPNAAGYIEIRRDGRKQYEHIYLAEKALGHKMPKGAVIHHMNEDKQDNFTPFNLIICPSQSYHQLLHQRMKLQKAGLL